MLVESCALSIANSIFSLKIDICKLKTDIFRLKMAVFNLKIGHAAFCLQLCGWLRLVSSWGVSRVFANEGALIFKAWRLLCGTGVEEMLGLVQKEHIAYPLFFRAQ